MKTQKSYLQVGPLRVTRGFALLTLVVFACLAVDMYRVTTYAPLADRLPTLPPSHTSSGDTYWSDTVGEVTLACIERSTGNDLMQYWHGDGTPAPAPLWNGYNLYSPIPGAESKKTCGFNFRFGKKSLPVMDIQIDAHGTRPKETYEERSVPSWPNLALQKVKDYGNYTWVTSNGMFPAETKSGNISIGIALEKDAVAISEMPFPGRLGGKKGIPFSVWDESMTDGNNNKTPLVYVEIPELPVDQQGHPLYHCQVYAVDWLGELHPQDGYSIREEAYIRSIRLVVTPYQWFTFQNRSLQPRPLNH